MAIIVWSCVATLLHAVIGHLQRFVGRQTVVDQKKPAHVKGTARPCQLFHHTQTLGIAHPSHQNNEL